MNSIEDKNWEEEVSSELAKGLKQIRRETAPPDSLERSLAAAERITMTSAAWERGIKNALMCGVLVWSVLGCVAFVISWLAQQSLMLSAAWAFGVFWVISFIWFLVSGLTGLIARGNTDELLLDCGPHPTRKLFLQTGAMFLIAGIAFGVASAEWISVAGSLFFVSFAVFWFILGTGRLRFYRSGIWQYWSLLRWEKVKAVRWQGDQDATLLLQTKARFTILGRGAFPVVIEQKEAVQELLLDKLPVDVVAPLSTDNYS